LNHCWLRLDYIFASAPIAALPRDCDVVDADDTVNASDLPIRAEFRHDAEASGVRTCVGASLVREEGIVLGKRAGF
jgi:hypothetical protein